MQRKIDFSNHVYSKFSDKYCTIYELKIPNTIINSIRFINSSGIMTVTGDFGNWVFCREFHPSANGAVSTGYWDEKLEIASVQNSHIFDSDETIREIEQYRNEYIEENDIISDEMMSWFEDLENNVFDEYDYINVAYRQNPAHIDHEYIPFGKVRHIWLEYIYDGFNEMCKRIKLQENETNVI